MKRTIELIVVLVVLLLLARYSAAAQVNDQPAQPTSPKDRVTPTEEVKPKADQPPVTLKVVGVSLRDNQNSPIGRVEDLIIDPASGRVEFLIVSTYYPTNSAKLLPIPWKAIGYRAEDSGMGGIPGANQVFALNFPRTKLQQAPTFERYRWPDMSQAGWRQPIYEFYQAKDLNEVGGAGSGSQRQSGIGTGVGPNTSTGPNSDPSVPSTNRTNSQSTLTNSLPQLRSTPTLSQPADSRTNSGLVPALRKQL